MTLHTLDNAARHINNRVFTRLTGADIRRHLQARRLIYQDITGSWITTPAADKALLRTAYGHHRHPMPGNPNHRQPHATVKVTDAGLLWLQIEMQTAGAETAA